MQPTTTLAQVQQWVKRQRQRFHTWLILIYHVINPDKNNLDDSDTYQPDFNAQMAWLSQSGITGERSTSAARILAQE